MRTLIGSFVRDERGTAAIEYGIILFLVAELILGAVYAAYERIKAWLGHAHPRVAAATEAR